MNTTATAPSEGQLRVLTRLAHERDYPLDKIDVGSLTGGRDGTATAAISMLLALPKIRRMYVGTVPQPDAGWYRFFAPEGRDRIVKVFHSKKRPEAWYVKEPKPAGGWSYLGQRVDLSNAEALSATQAGWYLGMEVS